MLILMFKLLLIKKNNQRAEMKTYNSEQNQKDQISIKRPTVLGVQKGNRRLSRLLKPRKMTVLKIKKQKLSRIGKVSLS